MTLWNLPMLKVKRHVNHLISQTVLTYHLSCLLFVIANISGHLTTHITVQILKVSLHNAQRMVQWWTVPCLLTYLLTYLRTYLISPYSRILLEKLTLLQLVKKFPAFYGTRRFITAFTIARHLSLSSASLIQSISSHPNCPFSVA
jgi:hypothetical protein